LADDERFETNAARVVNRETLAGLLNEKIGDNARDFWMDTLQEAGITVTSINSVADVLADPQAEARKSVWEVEHPALGNIQLMGSALQHLSRTPASPQGHPPLLGEHTEEVLSEVLGMSDSEIKALIDDQVVKGR
jgi:crotonobetainyl-CoA:carnitine CoA-transferase CaiB-like acyl-CoA transferase